MGLSLLAGLVSAGLGASALREWYRGLILPPLVPDGGFFGPAWASLYILTGLSAWLVWRMGRRGVVESLEATRALRRWGWQLLVNAAWVPAFFGLRSPLLGLAVVVPMLALIGWTTVSFAQVRRLAAGLMLPYLLWSCYIAYLTAGVWWLNPRG